MDYQKAYDDLICAAKARVLSCDYKETHHVIPRCLGGNNSKENLVDLTLREHFVAHKLLTKIYPTHPKIHAAFTMMFRGKCRDELRFTSHDFELRRKSYYIANKHSHLKGMVMVKDVDGVVLKVSNTDPRYVSGELVHINKGRPMAPQTKDAIMNAVVGREAWNKGKKLSDDHRKKIIAAQTGTKRSDESKARSKQALTDFYAKNPHHTKGKPQQKVTCPHCGKIGGNVMKKYHFDNCKKRNED